MNWLQKILKELEEAPSTELHSPQSEMEEGEIVLGTLDDPMLKALFHVVALRRARELELREQVLRTGCALIGRHGTKSIPEEDRAPLDKLETEASRIGKEADLLQKIMWRCIHEEWDSKVSEETTGLGLRKDWQIVAYTEKEEPSIPFIQHMLGMGVVRAGS